MVYHWRLNKSRYHQSKCARYVWDYKKANFEKANDLFANYVWDLIFNDHSFINSIWSKWYQGIYGRYVHLYSKEKSVWFVYITLSILRNIKERNRVFQKFERTKSVYTWSEYKILRNKVISLIRLNKRKYIESLNPSTKLFWKFVKGLKKERNSIPKLYSSSTQRILKKLLL